MISYDSDEFRSRLPSATADTVCGGQELICSTDVFSVDSSVGSADVHYSWHTEHGASSTSKYGRVCR